MTDKSINTLIPDIIDVLKDDHKGTILPEALKDFYDSSGTALIRAIESPERKEGRPERTLYASELREVEICPRRVWYKANMPDAKEVIPPQVRVKFLYGDLIESLAIFLAAQAGHAVSDFQKPVRATFQDDIGSDPIHIRGKMDCTIDGHIIDVKSMSAYSFKRSAQKDYDWDADAFSYHRQLQFYNHIDGDSCWLPNPPTAAVLGVEKQSGDIMIKAVPPVTQEDWYAKIVRPAQALFDQTVAPSMPTNDHVGDVPATLGNRKLKTYCSYCPVKAQCWKDQGVRLRGFAYANGPVIMTEVKKVPKDIPEFPVE